MVIEVPEGRPALVDSWMVAVERFVDHILDQKRRAVRQRVIGTQQDRAKVGPQGKDPHVAVGDGRVTERDIDI